MDSEQLSPHFHIWQLCLGFANTHVLHTLVKSGVIEQMREHSRTLSELTQACGLNADVLYRMLRFAVVIGVVEYKDNWYSLTETGIFLLKDVPGSLYMGILLFGKEPLQQSWQNLDYTLSTGNIAFEYVKGETFFEYIDNHPDFGIPFHKWMTITSMAANGAITEAYDFTPFKSVCDIGGGQGLLLKSILTAHPHLRGILFDQESVLKDHILADLNGRVKIQGGDFFEHVPAADVLVMKRVVHDWNDEKCQLILSNCRQAMNSSSRLLVIDAVIEGSTDLIGTFYDLHMQVINGGRERTEEEFNLLFKKAGMNINRIISTKSPLKIIEASIRT